MNFLKLDKMSWLVWFCTVAMIFTVNSSILADDWNDDWEDESVEPEDENTGDTIEATGKGRKKSYAIADAWKKAMMMYLDENIDADDLEANAQKIEKWLDENWQKYTTGNWQRLTREQVVYNWDRDEREMTIRVTIKGDILLRDIERLTTKVRDKLAGLKVGIADEVKPSVSVGDEWLDRSTMFAAVSNILGTHMTVVDLDAVQNAMKMENLSNEISAADDPSGYSMEIWNQCNLKILLSLKTKGIKDVVTGYNFWYATISCRMIDVQTGQQLIYFQMESGAESGAKPVSAYVRGERKARDEAIAELAKQVARKMIEQAKNRKTIVEENVYELRFIGFTRRDSEKIESMVMDLSSGRDRDMTVEPGSVSTGTKIIYKIKWLRTKDSQIHILNTIKEECEMNNVKVDSSKSRQGILWFEPVGFEGMDE
jgi:hypothetical protein